MNIHCCLHAFLLLSCTVLGGNPIPLLLAILWMIKLDSPLILWELIASCVYALLQLLSTFVINVVASTSDSLNESLFTDERALLGGLGIFKASSDELGQFIASWVPQVILLLYVPLARHYLRQRVRRWALPPTSVVFSAFAMGACSLVNPTLIAAPFSLFGVILVVWCSISSTWSLVPSVSLLSTIYISLWIVAVAIFQNKWLQALGVPEIDVSVGLSSLADLTFSRRVMFLIQMILAFLSFILSRLLVNYQQPVSPANVSLLPVSKVPSVVASFVTMVKSFSVSLLRFLFSYPLVPLMFTAVICIIFPSIASAVVFLFVVLGLLLNARQLQPLLPFVLFIVSLLALWQYIVGIEILHLSTTVRNITLTTDFDPLWKRVAEITSMFLVLLIFCSIYYMQRDHLRRQQQSHPRSEREDHAQPFDVFDQAKETLGEERVHQLLSYLKRDPQGTVDVPATFIALVKRSPTSVELETIGVGEEAEVLLLKMSVEYFNASVISSIWAATRLACKQYSTAVALLATYAAATCNKTLDVLHFIMLLFFLLFLCFPSFSRRYWMLLVGYMVFVVCLLTWTTAVFRIPPSTLSSTWQDLIGLTEWHSHWEAVIFYIALFAIAAVQMLLNRSYSSVWEVIMFYEWRLHSEQLLVSSWKKRGTLLLIVVVFVIIGLLQKKSILAGIFLLIVMGLLLCSAYRFSDAVMRWLWRIAVFYSTLAMLIVSFYQFPRIQKSVDDNLFAKLSLCSTPESCATQFGVRVPSSSAILSFGLAPWFVAVVISYYNLSNHHSSSVSFRATTHQKFLWYLERGFEKLDSCSKIIGLIGRAQGEKLLWLVLVIASFFHTDGLSFIYLLAFLMDVSNLPVVIYAMLHMAVLYGYSFTFVPKISNQKVAHGIGLFDSSPDTLTVSVLSPVLVFFAGIACQRCRCTVESEDVSSQRFSFPRIAGFMGYECLLLISLITFCLTYSNIEGVPVFIALCVLLTCGRMSFFTSSCFVVCTFCCFAVTMMNEFVVRWNKLVQFWTTDHNKAYWALGESIAPVVMMSLCIAAHHIMRRTMGLVRKNQADLKEEYGTDSFSAYWVSKNLQTTALIDIGALEMNTSHLVNDEQPEQQTLEFQITKALSEFCTVCIPAALFGFIDGATESSMIHAFLMGGGIIGFSFRDKVLFQFHWKWKKFVKYLLILPLLSIVFHIPPILSWSHEHPNILIFLGLYSKPRHDTIGFSGIRAVFFLMAMVHIRVFDEFCYGGILLSKKKELESRQQRYVKLMRKMKEKDEKDVAEVNANDLMLKERLEHVRKLPTVIAATPQAERLLLVEEEEEVPREEKALTPINDHYEEKEERSETVVEVEGRDHQEKQVTSATTEETPLTTENEPEGDAKPQEESKFLQAWNKVKKTAVSAAEALVLFFSQNSYQNPDVPGPSEKSVWMRLLTAMGWCFQYYTSVLVMVAMVANFAGSGSIWDMVPAFIFLSAGISFYPEAPLKQYRWISLYVLVGILLKFIVVIFMNQIQFGHGFASFVDWVLTPTFYSTGSTTAHDIDLVLDFVVFLSIIMHKTLALRNGLYSIEEQDISALPLEEGKPPGVKSHLAKYWENIVTRRGTGRDYYLLNICLEAIALIVFLLAYYTMAGKKRGNILESVKNNMLPGELVMVIFATLIQMIVDRMIYIKNSNVLRYGFQSLVNGCVFIGYVLWWNLVQPQVYIPGILFFILKWMAGYVSALQVRYGFPQIKHHDPFTKYPESTVRWIGYMIFMYTPMLWEMRVLTDWMVSTTSLQLSPWLKVEDLIDIVYNRKQTIVENREEKEYSPMSQLLLKVFRAGIRMLLIMVALLFPLLYYSTFNPSTMANSVSKVDISLAFQTTTAFTSANFYGEDIPPNYVNWLETTRPVLSQFDLTANGRSAQLMNISSCSSDIWMISPQAQRLLQTYFDRAINNLSKVEFKLQMEFSRKGTTGTASTTQTIWHTWEAPRETILNLSTAIQSNSTASSDLIFLPNFYSPFVFNDPVAIQYFPTMAKDPNEDVVGCSLILRSEFDKDIGSTVRYWCLKCDSLFTSGNIPNANTSLYPEWPCLQGQSDCSPYNFESGAKKPDEKNNMYFVIFSDRIPETISFLPNIGIIAIYTTFVLALGKVLRGMFSGAARNIILSDMANPEPVEQLIDYVLLARLTGDLELENLIYCEIIDLLRCPEKLFRLTGPKSKEVNKKEKSE